MIKPSDFDAVDESGLSIRLPAPVVSAQSPASPAEGPFAGEEDSDGQRGGRWRRIYWAPIVIVAIFVVGVWMEPGNPESERWQPPSATLQPPDEASITPPSVGTPSPEAEAPLEDRVPAFSSRVLMTFLAEGEHDTLPQSPSEDDYLTEADLVSVTLYEHSADTNADVELEFTYDGAEKLKRLSERNIDRMFTVFIDGQFRLSVRTTGVMESPFRMNDLSDSFGPYFRDLIQSALENR